MTMILHFPWGNFCHNFLSISLSCADICLKYFMFADPSPIWVFLFFWMSNSQSLLILIVFVGLSMLAYLAEICSDLLPFAFVVLVCERFFGESFNSFLNV